MPHQSRGIAIRSRSRLHAGIALLLALLLFRPGAGWGQPAWQDDFARLCGGVETAGTLSVEQLDGRVGECDRVLAAIRAEDANQHKVEIFRLEKCRNFYAYLASLARAETR